MDLKQLENGCQDCTDVAQKRDTLYSYKQDNDPLEPIKDMYILHLVGKNELPQHFARGHSL